MSDDDLVTQARELFAGETIGDALAHELANEVERLRYALGVICLLPTTEFNAITGEWDTDFGWRNSRLIAMRALGRIADAE